ncbi:hypothetical protein CYR55_05955 [Chimaeribacter californicus]|uniref:Toxin YoeB n=1 Tax=Chimaeribacter californicus TaxID=2060067 RepID=A0A2N5EE60_9GAMM|nr:hypothetical protein [Chimaeribacter californicus]PLR40820.1 hypothetical protein CYR55_05955 [Chimaeribacter californicus]
MGYIFNDDAASKAYQSGKSRAVHPAGMKKYYEWRRLIRDRGMSPSDSAKKVGDLHYEKLTGNKCSIRLTQGDRVLFSVQGHNVTVYGIGGHY